MNIEVSKANVVRNHQCISCMECTSNNACPKGETVKMKGTKGIVEKVKVNLVNISALLVALVVIVFVTAGITTDASTSYSSSFDGTEITTKLNGEYTSGTYTGEGIGFNSGLCVELTIEDNQITSLEIISHNETLGYYEAAFASVPSSIMIAQSTDVDTVSGATRSSEGIIEAVNDALSKAEVLEGEQTTVDDINEQEDALLMDQEVEKETVDLVQETTQSEEAINQEEAANEEEAINQEEVQDDTNVNQESSQDDSQEVKESLGETSEKDQDSVEENVTVSETNEEDGGLYIDGIYTGSAMGYKESLTVQVTVENSNITGIEVTDNDETPLFLERAIAVIEDMISSQSTDVDVVSGATLSSNAIINGTKDALSSATK
jgi:uncharacterized protein with FMN-binding domain